MTGREETRQGQTGGSQENLAAGEAAAIVPQLRRRREAGSHCEPFDCTAAGCRGVGTTETPEPVDAEDIDPDGMTELWANAKIAWAARDFPKYGSREWIALEPGDPRRLAGALEAAEMWRKYGDEEELVTWLKNLGRRPNLIDTRSRAQLDEAAKPKPPHQLQATPGWPPIRIPGGRGRYLTHEYREAA